MAKKKGRMPIRRKCALPGPRAKILKKVVGDPVKDIYLPAAKKAYWDAPRAGMGPIASVGASLTRAVGAAGKSLLKDYQGSSLQKRFEGTPITAETKFETQASPMRSTAQAARPVRKPKGTRRRIVKGHRAPAKGHRDVGKNEPDHDKYWMFPR